MSSEQIVRLLSVCLIIFGCSTTQMVQTRYAGGKTETLVYTTFYDAGAWLEEGKLGLQVVVEHEKTTIPILYPLQAATGTLGASDLEAQGKVTLVFWNLEGRKRLIKVLKATNLHQRRSITDQYTIGAEGQKRSSVNVGSFKVFNYGTEFQVAVDYEVDGVAGNKEMLVKRRTEQEMSSFFGPNGRPPYPWYEAPYYFPKAVSP